MQARSTATRIPDPYRAGLDLGLALADLAPEVVFLFATEHFIATDALLQGLHDGLEQDDVIVIGNCGFGFYESRDVGDIGASALGLNSGGAIRWQLGIGSGVGADPAGATRAAIAAASQRLNGREPALYFLLADFRTDSALIEQVLEHEVKAPVVGGLSLDNPTPQGCALFANRQRLEDCVLVLAADGPLRFEIFTANRLPVVGRPGVVDVAEGTLLRQVSGVSAREFIVRESDQPLPTRMQGIVPLTFTNPDNPEVRRVRSVLVSPAEGEAGDQEGPVTLFAGIEAGKEVQVCQASPADLLAQVSALAEEAERCDFTPAAALVVSCAGRRVLLEDRTREEVQAVTARLGTLPLAGFPSGGEIGPVRTAQGYSHNLFHNMSFVLLLIAS